MNTKKCQVFFVRITRIILLVSGRETMGLHDGIQTYSLPRLLAHLNSVRNLELEPVRVGPRMGLMKSLKLWDLHMLQGMK